MRSGLDLRLAIPKIEPAAMAEGAKSARNGRATGSASGTAQSQKASFTQNLGELFTQGSLTRLAAKPARVERDAPEHAAAPDARGEPTPEKPHKPARHRDADAGAGSHGKKDIADRPKQGTLSEEHVETTEERLFAKTDKVAEKPASEPAVDPDATSIDTESGEASAEITSDTKAETVTRDASSAPADRAAAPSPATDVRPAETGATSHALVGDVATIVAPDADAAPASVPNPGAILAGNGAAAAPAGAIVQNIDPAAAEVETTAGNAAGAATKSQAVEVAALLAAETAAKTEANGLEKTKLAVASATETASPADDAFANAVEAEGADATKAQAKPAIEAKGSQPAEPGANKGLARALEAVGGAGKPEWFTDLVSANAQNGRSNSLAPGIEKLGAHPATPGLEISRPTPLQMLPIEIGMQAVRGVTRFAIRLDPAELGRVDVHLEIHKNGEVNASLVVDRVETLQMLRRDASTLQQALEQAGLKQSGDSLNFSLRSDNQQGQSNQDGHSPRGGADLDEESLRLQAQLETSVMRRVMIPNSSLDLMI